MMLLLPIICCLDLKESYLPVPVTARLVSVASEENDPYQKFSKPSCGSTLVLSCLL